MFFFHTSVGSDHYFPSSLWLRTYTEHIVPIHSKCPLFKKLILILRHTTSHDHRPINGNLLVISYCQKFILRFAFKHGTTPSAGEFIEGILAELKPETKSFYRGYFSRAQTRDKVFGVNSY